MTFGRLLQISVQSIPDFLNTNRIEPKLVTWLFWLPLLKSWGSQNSHVTMFGSILLVFWKSWVLRTVSGASRLWFVCDLINYSAILQSTHKQIFKEYFLLLNLKGLNWNYFDNYHHLKISILVLMFCVYRES
jgi:hypothetical protein